MVVDKIMIEPNCSNSFKISVINHHGITVDNKLSHNPERDFILVLYLILNSHRLFWSIRILWKINFRIILLFCEAIENPAVGGDITYISHISFNKLIN